MWVILRLLTAALVGAAKYFRRHASFAERRIRGDIPWVFTQSKHKGRIVGTRFGVPFEHPVFFQLSREGGLDAWFKRIGFTHEVQTGDPEFDELVYVSCDHPALAPVLQADGEVRAAIQRLVGHTATKRMHADGAHLWVDRGGDAMPDDAAIRDLDTVRSALAAIPAEHLQVLRDPFFWRALLVESIVWGAVFYGAPAVLEMTVRGHPQYFAWSPVIVTGLGASVGIFALLLGLAWWLLRGSSRTHRVITESAILLAIGVPLSSIQMVSDVNIALDRSVPEIISPEVREKYTRITRSRKGRTRTHYHPRFRS